MSPVDFSIIVPKMRTAIEDYIRREAEQGVKLGERQAILQWMERYYESWFHAQVGFPATEPVPEGEKDGIDRRRHRRIPIELSAYYRVLWTPQGDKHADNEPSETADVKNISAGGLYIVTGRAYPISTLMEIQFELPGFPDSISAFAMVVWRQERSFGRNGHGLHFSHIETRDSNLIDEAIMEKLLDAPVVIVKDGDA